MSSSIVMSTVVRCRAEESCSLCCLSGGHSQQTSQGELVPFSLSLFLTHSCVSPASPLQILCRYC